MVGNDSKIPNFLQNQATLSLSPCQPLPLSSKQCILTISRLPYEQQQLLMATSILYLFILIIDIKYKIRKIQFSLQNIIKVIIYSQNIKYQIINQNKQDKAMRKQQIYYCQLAHNKIDNKKLHRYINMGYPSYLFYIVLYSLLLCIINCDNNTTASLKIQNKTFSQAEQIIIDYQGASKLSHFFYGIQNQLYVDIGAYDPIYHSNTLKLHMKGWHGVNVQPNWERIRKFYEQRPSQMNLNTAVGQSNTFMFMSSLQNGLDHPVPEQSNQNMISSVSLKQLCAKYYKKRPLLINIAITDMSFKILQTNDWSNDKCLPDMFSVAKSLKQFNNEQAVWAQLSANNYTLIKIYWQQYAIYIKNTHISTYLTNYQQSINKIIGKNVVKYYDLIKIVQFVLNIKINVVPHQYNTSAAYLYTVTDGQIIDINKLLRILKYSPYKQYDVYDNDYSIYTIANKNNSNKNNSIYNNTISNNSINNNNSKYNNNNNNNNSKYIQYKYKHSTQQIVILNYNINQHIFIIPHCNISIQQIHIQYNINIYNITIWEYDQQNNGITFIYIYAVNLNKYINKSYNNINNEQNIKIIGNQQCKYNKMQGKFIQVDNSYNIMSMINKNNTILILFILLIISVCINIYTYKNKNKNKIHTSIVQQSQETVNIAKTNSVSPRLQQ